MKKVYIVGVNAYYGDAGNYPNTDDLIYGVYTDLDKATAAYDDLAKKNDPGPYCVTVAYLAAVDTDTDPGADCHYTIVKGDKVH